MSPSASRDETPTIQPSRAGAGAGTAVDARQLESLAAINPLVAAANPMLMTIASLRYGAAPGDVDLLRSQLIGMVHEFDAACERAGIPTDHGHYARYALCTALDEAIQRALWRRDTNWAGKSLMAHFFKDIHGGERFFRILDKLVEAPSKNAWLLQLFFVCLSLGFAGQFELRGAEGTQALVNLRERLYEVIRRGQPEVERALCGHWRGLNVAARQFKGFALTWFVLASLVLLSLVVYVGFLLLLADARDDIPLGKLALKAAPPAATPAPPPKPRLRQLLATDIAAGQIQLTENQYESMVTLGSEGTFESGSATPSERAVALVQRVAAEMDKLEGRIVVTGHTDSIPSRTLQFPTNDELSRARARAVAGVVAGRLRDPGRVVFEGRGDRAPVADNQSAEGRAKNRRVEITLRVANANP